MIFPKKSFVLSLESFIFLPTGMKPSVAWLAWCLNNLLSQLLMVFIIAYMLKMGNVLPYSDPTLIGTFMMAFSLSAVCLSLISHWGLLHQHKSGEALCLQQAV